jgi:hypothetical protein
LDLHWNFGSSPFFPPFFFLFPSLQILSTAMSTERGTALYTALVCVRTQGEKKRSSTVINKVEF